MLYEAVAQMEMDLAEDLRRAGYTVTGGHSRQEPSFAQIKRVTPLKRSQVE